MQHLSPVDVFTHAVREMADAISDRPGETREQSLVRSQVATQMILGLAPRDLPEAMLAGHGIMFHALLTDSIRRAFQDESDTTRQNARRSNLGMIVALSRSFHRSLSKLEEYQSFPERSEAEPDAAKPEADPAPATTARPADGPIPRETIPADGPAQVPPLYNPDQTNAGHGTVVSPAGRDAMNAGSASGNDPAAIPTNALRGARSMMDETRTTNLNRAQRRQLRHGGWRDNITAP